MVIKINYTSSDVYVSTSVSPVYVVVNYSGTTTGAAVWGQITGTLSDQTDLQNALDAKFDDPTGTTAQYLRGDGSLATFPTIPSGTVTSVGLTMPSAFSVANSPITSSGTLAVTGAGTASQYVRGDGQLATLPSNSSGGSSVAYYLNGSVAASVGTYYQMSKTAVIGTGTDFSKAGNGLISQFLTDVADPNRLEIPAGAWNFEMYFSASSSGGTPAFYVELLKYDGTTFTSIASSSAVPEAITSGTLIDLYLTSLAIPQTTLLSTDRLAIRVYIVNSTGGRTITMHTENSHLCEIITNFAGGVSAFNGLTANTQYFATGTSGTDFAISSATDTHTFNLPTASATNRGALSSADWSTFSGKVGGSGTSGQVAYWNGTNSQTGSNNLFWDAANARLGIGTNAPTEKVTIIGTTNSRINFKDPSFDRYVNLGISNTGEVRLNRTGTASWQFLQIGDNTSLTYLDQTNLIIRRGGDAETARFFSTGNFGIGTGASDSGQRLQVQGTTLITGNTLISAGNLSIFTTNTPRRLNLQVANGSLAAALGIYDGGGSLASIIGIETTPSNDLQLASVAGIKFYSGSTLGNIVTNPTNERMRLTSAGRLLLGTTTESTFILDVNGTARVSGNTTINGSIFLSSTSNVVAGASGDGLYLQGQTRTYFYTGTNTFFARGFNGALLVGTTANVSDPNLSAVLEASSTTQGFLPPRMTTTEKNAISSPAAGLVVYDTTLNKLCVRTASTWETITSL